MPETVGTPLLWAGFTAFVIAMLVLDLLVFQKREHEVKPKEALAWSIGWVSLAMLFNLGVYRYFGAQRGLEFFTGYLIELALSAACKVFSEMIGNIARDATSAVKYWHFIRLMGRSASHVTLECALQTHPNITLISEDVQAKGTTLEEIVDYIADVIVKRAQEGCNYGVLLVPEGLPEFISDIKAMIDELSALLARDEDYIKGLSDHSERAQYITGELGDASAKVYNSLPVEIQEVLMKRDAHGNVPLSQVETERLLIDLVSDKIRFIKAHDGKKFVKFSPLNHFFGYEGRCAAPTNFDADYTYSLGYAAAQLVRANLTGYTAMVQNMTKQSQEWVAGGVPVTMMLNMETRKGQEVPVIKKALVDLEGAPFKKFAQNREDWALNDEYTFPGPIQYFGPSEIADRTTETLALEKGC